MGEGRGARQEGSKASKTGEPGHSEDQDDAPSMVDVLPDDVLVQVLSLLDMGSVLRARMTCRRLRDLGVHPDVWRHRELRTQGQGAWPWPYVRRPMMPFSPSVSLVKAVLRVAPCARLITLNHREYVRFHSRADFTRNRIARKDARELAALFQTTACAFEHVSVPISRDVSETAVRNQLTLGRVKTLHVDLEGYEGKDDWPLRLFNLVRYLFTAPELTKLSVRTRWESSFPPSGKLANYAPTEVVPPTLRKLTLSCYCSETFLPVEFVDFLFRSHAATLEEVEFRENEITLSATAKAALAAAPRLRVLKCCAWPDLVLPADGPLRELIVGLTEKSQPEDFLRAGKPFLRTATRLERLELYSWSWSENVNELERAVEAVASSGRSALRDLRLGRAPPMMPLPWQRERSDWPDLALLVRTLPSLRHLASLTLYSPPSDRFYAALSARAVPQLKLLRVNLCRRQCTHDWMHGLLDLLEELPELRLVAGQGNRCGMEGSLDMKLPCIPCQQGCHIAVPRSEISRVSCYEFNFFTWRCCDYEGPRRGGRLRCCDYKALLRGGRLWAEAEQPPAAKEGRMQTGSVGGGVG